jgi:thymidylate kinase
MALIILEGLDRTGKTSVAQMFEKQGFEILHISAPPKGTSPDQYVGEWVDLLTSIQGRNVILDRSHYGELVWPQVYGRTPLLDEESMDVLRSIEVNMEVTRILMYDPDSRAHWQRCVDNKEPLTQPQFVKARSLFSTMADKYDFARKTLKDFPNAVQPLPVNKSVASNAPATGETATSTEEVEGNKDSHLAKTKEQLKLERANVINEVLSKRLLKGKGPMYDEIERNIRHFLNQELGKILGTTSQTPGLTNEEIDMLKFFCKHLKDKENQK